MLLAFALQPLVAGVVAFAMFPVIEYTGRPFMSGQFVDVMDAARAVGFGAALAAVFIVPLAAFPLFIWMKRRGAIRLKDALLCGFALGNLPGLLITISLIANAGARGAVPSPALAVVRAIALPGFIGAACAAGFWLMTRSVIGEARR